VIEKGQLRRFGERLRKPDHELSPKLVVLEVRHADCMA